MRPLAEAAVYLLTVRLLLLLTLPLVLPWQEASAQFRFDTWTTDTGLPANHVRGVAQTPDGYLWVATIDGLARFDGVRFTVFDKANTPGIGSNRFTDLHVDEGGTLWAGTEDSGVVTYRGGRFTSYAPPDGFPSAEATTFMPGRDGELLVRTPSEAYYARAGEFPYAHPTYGPRGSQFYFSPSGALWTLDENGVTHSKDGRLTEYPLKLDFRNNVLAHISFLEDRRGRLWFGVVGGLHMYEGGRLRRMSDPGHDNTVWAIRGDRAGDVWVATVRGLYKYRGDAPVAHYTTRDGLPGDDVKVIHESRDGTLWFPTMDGVAVIDPEAMRVNSLPPPVLIESAMVERGHFALSGEVVLEPGQGDLEIAYTANSFIRPEQIKFKYKLEGLDKDWNDAGARRTAFFPYLPPGEYTFRVTAANSDGVWNTEGASIRVVVRAPFWRSRWFVALCVAAASGLVLLAFAAHLSHVRRRQAAQEAFARQLIESQEGERKRIAAEMHDSLGQLLLIIKNRALVGVKATEGNGAGEPQLLSAREQLEEIGEAAASAINQAREIAYNLRPLQLERLGLTSAIAEMLEHLTEASGIRFDFESDPLDGVFAEEDEINFFRIVQEGANNVVKHAGARRARVRIRRGVQAVELIVRDDGRGFDPSAAQANGAGRHGFGLKGMAERARLLGGDYAVRSSPGGGTILTVRIRNRKSRITARRVRSNDGRAD